MKTTFLIAIAGSALSLGFAGTCLSAQEHRVEKIEPRVLVVATYETGNDTGDVPGELQYWVERQKLDHAISVPGLQHPLLTNDKGLYAMISGVTSRSALQMMALAMDPRVDLTHTYILLSGIGGADPANVSIGSAVWIRQVVDGDPAYELDSREIPASWPYGTIAIGATKPDAVPPDANDTPAAGVSEGGSGGIGRVVLPLNPSLVEWAYSLTKGITLPDSSTLAAWRAPFKSYPAGVQAPSILEGTSLGTDHFWHGVAFTRWAENWVRLYTRGSGRLDISDSEDQGIELAVRQLGQLSRLDASRVLILRTASNYTVPRPGTSPEKSLFVDLPHSPGYLPALEADYRVGSVVVSTLLGHWDEYRDHVP